MTDSDFSLKKPPIIEAVLDIDCDLPPGQKFESFEEPARERFQDRYPKFRRQFVHQHQFEVNQDGISDTPVFHAVQAFQFPQEDKKQLVQVRIQGFSFNRLAPYTRLHDYFPEIERTWNLYREITSPIQIRTIRLRYINRILLPFKDGKVDLDKFLLLGPRLPEEERFTIGGFLNQQTLEEIGTGNQVNLVLTAQLPEKGYLPIILDNCVFTTDRGSPEDWTWILSKIQTLRCLKNDIFRRTVTEECLKLFQ